MRAASVSLALITSAVLMNPASIAKADVVTIAELRSRYPEHIVAALLDVISPKGLFERSDVGTRRAEGLQDRPTGPVAGDEPERVRAPTAGWGLHLRVVF